MNKHHVNYREGEETSNDPKLSDSPERHATCETSINEAARPNESGATKEESTARDAQASSLERLVRRLSFVLAEKNEEIRWAAVDAVSDEELQSNMDEIAASIIQRLFRTDIFQGVQASRGVEAKAALSTQPISKDLFE